MLHKIKQFFSLLVLSGKRFLATNSFEKGASLSYYTVFALPPVLIIIITLAGSFFGRETVSGEIYSELHEVLGPEGALEIQSMVEKIRETTTSGYTALIGLSTLLIAATGAFVSMQDSLNSIWCVKPKPRNQVIKIIADRFLSFLLILGITLLLLLSLATNAILVAMGPYLERVFSGALVYYFIHGGNLLLMLAVLTLLFASIYKFLPDATITWADVWFGAFVTAVLFSLGRSLIGLYIGSSDLASIYGTAGTVVLLLVWVFYSSQILFFGAVFTREYAHKHGHPIYPSAYAVRVVNQEVELGKTAVNEEDGLPLEAPPELPDPYLSSDPHAPESRDREEMSGRKPF